MKKKSKPGLLALAFLAAWATATGMGKARADEDPSAADLGVKVETLSRSDRSWNGDLLPKLNDVQAEVTVLRITVPAGVTLPRHFHPVINAGVLLQGKVASRKRRRRQPIPATRPGINRNGQQSAPRHQPGS